MKGNGIHVAVCAARGYWRASIYVPIATGKRKQFFRGIGMRVNEHTKAEAEAAARKMVEVQFANYPYNRIDLWVSDAQKAEIMARAEEYGVSVNELICGALNLQSKADRLIGEKCDNTVSLEDYFTQLTGEVFAKNVS